ncbi:glycosyltransferase family A protein [Brevibacillus fulvus]|uniref:GT2 family glycosyltransferase n=1 Tax=Brevibacillus fulvus TaxID=1125967 RepID=A0A939BTR4_9BACL|nr:glycosyltransferase family 2 protein [Brevibacillus fulvus]MBM7589744.1 GT2 family glycosyltransferase [Brevibacillus fulvus]
MFASVVIPTRNAVDRLLYTLLSLNLQYVPFDQFEVIVVDNASTDGLDKRIQSFQANYPLRYIRLKTRVLPYQVLNTGIRNAHGEVVIFLGANMIVPRHFVGTHLQLHSRTDRLVLVSANWKRVYSVWYPAYSHCQKQECQRWLANYPQIKRPYTKQKTVKLLEEWHIANGLLFDIALPAPRPNPVPAAELAWSAFGTQHLSMPRSAFGRVGLFHGPSRLRSLTDREMARRLRRAGFQCRINDKVTLLCQERPPQRTAKKRPWR